ncbi:MAG TPA: hypothetical protein VN912_02030 [Candidatus Angelobacter sp.]|nr:hypothetical protein [Candidatus Angelobacter sp.]
MDRTKLSNLSLWFAAFCPLLTAACSPVAAAHNGSYTIATAPPDADFLSIFDGTADAQFNLDGTACVSIVWRKTKTAILWPRGYTARGNPLAVYDEQGKQVLVAGETLSRTFLQPPLGWGQVLSRRVRDVKGCSGFSQSVAYVPTPSPVVATPGVEEYDALQIGKMQNGVDTYRQVFSGLYADPTSHIVTIAVAPTADPADLAQAKEWLRAASGGGLGFHSPDHYRVGFVVAGPSLATLDVVLDRLQIAQPWRKDVGNNLTRWYIDPVRHKAVIGVLEITPTLSADARAAFGNLAVLETAEPAMDLSG